MKPVALIVTFFLLSLNTAWAQLGTLNEDESLALSGDASEELPEFPGGIVEMMRYVKANVKIPQQAIDKNIIGKCYLKFLVKADGSIDEISVLKGVTGCPDCDAEAIRVVKSMPKWKPGTIGGVPVALYYNLPVAFNHSGK
jgi:periplasmic protein TonB